MNLFDRDFWKFSTQFLAVIFIAMFFISMVGSMMVTSQDQNQISGVSEETK